MTQRQFIEKFSLFNPNLEIWIGREEYMVNTHSILQDYLNDAISFTNQGIYYNTNMFNDCIYTPTKIICLI